MFQLRLNGLIILVSFSLVAWSFMNRNKLLDDMSVASWLLDEPIQFATDREARTETVGDYDYEIKPLYDYEISGLVVSYRRHSPKQGMHRLTKDHLNVADICIVWGKNATDIPLTKIEFWNQDFICYVRTENDIWRRFNMDELSNNHLITNDPAVRAAISEVGVGDQITIKGWLAEYRNVQTGGHRGTSTIRTDTGNGACETILVDSITIETSYTSKWRTIMYVALLVFLASLAWYFIKPMRMNQ